MSLRSHIQFGKANNYKTVSSLIAVHHRNLYFTSAKCSEFNPPSFKCDHLILKLGNKLKQTLVIFSLIELDEHSLSLFYYFFSSSIALFIFFIVWNRCQTSLLMDDNIIFSKYHSSQRGLKKIPFFLVKVDTRFGKNIASKKYVS